MPRKYRFRRYRKRKAKVTPDFRKKVNKVIKKHERNKVEEKYTTDRATGGFYTTSSTGTLVLPMFSSTAVGTYATLTLGAGSDQVIGRKWTVKSLNYNFHFYTEADAAIEPTIRIIGVILKKPTGGPFATSDIVFNNGVTNQMIWGPYNPDNYKSTFTVFYDKTKIMRTANATYPGASANAIPVRAAAHFSINRFWKEGLQMISDSTGNHTNATIIQNLICFYILTDASVDQPEYAFSGVTRYIDS